MPLPDAAPLLGLHYDTARKRLQAGTLRGEKHGGRWLVWVPGVRSNIHLDIATHPLLAGRSIINVDNATDFIPDVIPDDPEPIPDAKPEDSGPVPDQTGRESASEFSPNLGRNSDELVLQLREEIAFLRQQVERQNHLIAGLIQRVPELPAGDAPTTRQEPHHAMHDAEPAADTSSWWERMLAWLRGV